MELKYPLKSLEEIVVQIVKYLGNLNTVQYSQNISILSENSIGKHIRHILEGLESLENGYLTGIVNYDNRIRQEVYEQDISAAQNRFLEILESLENHEEKELFIAADYSGDESKVALLTSSYNREIAYNLEHAIHHLAILKIATKFAFPEITIPQNFGIAYSTLKFQNSRISSK